MTMNESSGKIGAVLSEDYRVYLCYLRFNAGSLYRDAQQIAQELAISRSHSPPEVEDINDI